MKEQKLSTRVAEQLGHYVYVYVNSLDESVFYVGKGKGDRCFAHLNSRGNSRKDSLIRKLRRLGKTPRIEILAHGFSDEITALRVEAAAIDLLGLEKLTNEVRGWESRIVGRMGIRELSALYESKPVRVTEPALLIRINQLYRYGMTAKELYESTRGVWRLGDRRNKARYALGVYRGLVREVYKIASWHPAGTTPYETRANPNVRLPGRWEFVGKVAQATIREKYADKSVASYFARNSQNPVVYANC